MRRLIPLLLPLPALAQDVEIPLGIEVVTGYRSEYVYRGFALADDLIDVQLETEIALSEHWLLGLGGWYGTGTGSGSFDELAAFAALRYDAERWDAGFQAAWHGFDHSLFRDGVDFGPFANWRPNEDWRIGAALSYDTGPDGWYGRFEAEWSQPTGRDSFLSLLAGASGASGYYGRNGANDLYARASWTYAFNRSVAVTPFLGSSFALDSAGSDRLFGGLWFEVNF